MGDYLSPGQKAKAPLSNMALLTLLKRMNAPPKNEAKPDDAKVKPRWADPISGRPITAHGFRATFRTWAEEVATFPHAAIEHAMGHKVGGKVERAYNRTTLLDMRRKLMDASGRLLRAQGRVERSEARPMSISFWGGCSPSPSVTSCTGGSPTSKASRLSWWQ